MVLLSYYYLLREDSRRMMIYLCSTGNRWMHFNWSYWTLDLLVHKRRIHPFFSLTSPIGSSRATSCDTGCLRMIFKLMYHNDRGGILFFLLLRSDPISIQNDDKMILAACILLVSSWLWFFLHKVCFSSHHAQRLPPKKIHERFARAFLQCTTTSVFYY